jgi:hypothetical protein
VTLTTRDQVKGSNSIFKLGLVEEDLFILLNKNPVELKQCRLQITNKQKDNKRNVLYRKYFRRLASVFYVSNQVVPRIGAQLPYSNALSTVSVQQKHQNRNANLKKRKMKIKKCENQRKISSFYNPIFSYFAFFLLNFLS